MKLIFSILCGLALVASVGCVGPGIGPGCHQISHCSDCDGGFGSRPIPYGPLDGVRQLRKSLVCGGGCGEVYYGEWRSTPPHAADPCCGDQFVGGAVTCTPFCWERGTLLRAFYGKRIPCDDCGFANECDSCCDSGSVFSAPLTSSSGGGCNCGSNQSSQMLSSAVRPLPKVTQQQAAPQRIPVQRQASLSATTMPRQTGQPARTQQVMGNGR